MMQINSINNYSKQARKLTIGDYVTMLIKNLEDFKSKAKKV